MGMTATMPPALAKRASTSDFLKTNELAEFFRCMSQTILKAHSEDGHYAGIRPVKVNSRLLWPIADVWKMLQSSMSVTSAIVTNEVA